MKVTIVPLYLFMVLSTIAQPNEEVLYVDESNSYSLLINKETKIHKQYISDSHIETFVFTQNDQFKYTLTILRSKANNMTNDSLISSQYEQAYKANCGCEVLSSKQSKVDSINSLQFKIKRIEKNMVLLGYVDNFVVNGILFNLVFMTSESSFPIYQNEYSSIKSSFELSQ